MRRLVSFALAVALAAVAAPSAQRSGPPEGGHYEKSSSAPRVRVAYFFSDGNISGTLKAYKALLRERPDLRDRVAISFLTESMLADANVAEVSAAQVLVLDIMNQQMLERFNAEKKLDLIAAVRRRGTVLAVGEGLLPKEHYIKQGAVWDDRARTYWGHGGQSNQVGLLKYALTQAGIRGLTLPEPQRSMDFGYYYPVAAKSGGYRGDGQVFASWEEFTAWKQKAGKTRPGAPRIAVGFYKSNFYGGETELIDAVIGEIERRGGDAVPIFGYPGEIAAERLLLDRQGNARADALLGFFFNFSGPDAAKSLGKVDIPVLNLVSLYGRSEKDWRESAMGLSFFEGTFNVAVPEVAGTIAPTVVGSQEKITDIDTGMRVIVRRPIMPQVQLAVSRALGQATLRSTANRDKRVAVLFYNYPPGKANIGASYLNVAESLANVLQRLRQDGYDVGTADLSAASVLQTLLTRSRNVAGYAPGELQALVNEGGAVRVGIPEYSKWLNALSPVLKAKILKDWGEPAKSKVMTLNSSFIIPAVQYGKVALLPQPARGWGEDAERMYHAKDLAPHHQYVATYAWLREGFKAHAVVHVGTHGTLEWLDGKDAGLSPDDASDALIADLPHLYIYNVDVVGEGLVARRRSAAALVDHMVPPFRKGGLYPELAALGESINDFDTALHKNPELARAVGEQIRTQVNALGLAKDLGLDLSRPNSLDDATVHKIQDHILKLKAQNIPYGLHTFGRTPDKAMRDSTVDAIVSIDRRLLPKDAKVLASDMDARIIASGPREMDSLMRGLRGRYITTGSGGEPLRNPDSYPTGKNFYGIDPDKVPKPASYQMGIKLADQMLADHVKQHGRYPEKVSFVIWGDETMRHEGVLESQIFHLLGTKPVWDARGKVVDVEVIPRARLGRPRVDIVIASAAEGMFNNVTQLMDKAVQKVKALDEAENYVRKHYLSTKAILVQRGYTAEEADRRAGVRIFDEPPGTFNLNTSTIVAASGTWESDKGFANDYLKKLGHGYGNGFWGESMEDVFRLALSGTEKIVHSSSTMLYGALDNDDMFMYMGGLASAIRSVDGTDKSPELVITNTRDPGKPEMTSIDKFIGTEFRSRYINPTWIEGMKKEGYAGAGEMRQFVEYLWGWDATVSETVDDRMWQETFGVYVEDKHNLGMQQFFEKNSPFAYQDITARMLETVRKGNWKADASTQKKLIEEYVGSVNRHGVGCAEHTCGNPKLQKFVMEQGRRMGVPVPALEGFQKAMEQATGEGIDAGAERLDSFVRSNDARVTARLQAVPAPSRNVQQIEGQVMEARQTSTAPRNEARRDAVPSEWQAAAAALPILGVLVAWRYGRRRKSA
ncbi:MAG TPA: cobaltochelatase subunit CobN [Vicinamibacterales bacterium]|nr:cobaltochelatase subunit CobN [Vicinamibacterales bacterium]